MRSATNCELRADGDDAIIASLAWRFMHNNEYQRMTTADQKRPTRREKKRGKCNGIQRHSDCDRA
jgi:hypothetical protein